MMVSVQHKKMSGPTSETVCEGTDKNNEVEPEEWSHHLAYLEIVLLPEILQRTDQH